MALSWCHFGIHSQRYFLYHGAQWVSIYFYDVQSFVLSRRLCGCMHCAHMKDQWFRLCIRQGCHVGFRILLWQIVLGVIDPSFFNVYFRLWASNDPPAEDSNAYCICGVTYRSRPAIFGDGVDQWSNFVQKPHCHHYNWGIPREYLKCLLRNSEMEKPRSRIVKWGKRAVALVSVWSSEILYERGGHIELLNGLDVLFVSIADGKKSPLWGP